MIFDTLLYIPCLLYTSLQLRLKKRIIKLRKFNVESEHEDEECIDKKTSVKKIQEASVKKMFLLKKSLSALNAVKNAMPTPEYKYSKLVTS